MSIIATAVQHMMAAGMPADAIVAAVAAMESATDTRTTAAKRQARYRDRIAEKRNEASQSVTCDDNVTLKSLPDKEVFPQTPFQEINPSKKMGISRVREASPFPRPDWADPQHWTDFLANRKRKSLPNTATAHKKFIGDIERLTDADWPPGRLLEHAAAKGWAAIYDPRDKGDGQKRINTVGRIGAGSQIGRTVAAGAAFVAAGH